MSVLHKIQKELKVGKGNRNEFGKYNYRNCSDILEAVKPLMPEGFYVTLTDDIVMVGDRYYVKATATLTDGAGVSFSTTAFARESFDKKGMDDSQITGATSSYARKYALNGLFAIDDTKDADGMDNTGHHTKTDAQAKQDAEDKAYIALCNENRKTIDAVTSALENYEKAIAHQDQDSASSFLSVASEAWFELTEDQQVSLWRAYSKGGCFTTAHQKIIKSTEFRQANNWEKQQ